MERCAAFMRLQLRTIRTCRTCSVALILPGSRCRGPEGHLRIAQPFRVGTTVQPTSSPDGTAEITRTNRREPDPEGWQRVAPGLWPSSAAAT